MCERRRSDANQRTRRPRGSASALAAWDVNVSRDGCLIGLTATPKRGDNIGLEAVFQKVVYSKNIREMIKRGLPDAAGGIHREDARRRWTASRPSPATSIRASWPTP
jgi:hypothetical protein